MKIIVAVLALLVMAIPTRSGTFISGSNTCPSSGNKKVSNGTGNQNMFQLTIFATITNTGFIHLGGADVTTSNGGVLPPGASYNASKPSAAINPNTIYFACTVSADTISWIGSQ